MQSSRAVFSGLQTQQGFGFVAAESEDVLVTEALVVCAAADEMGETAGEDILASYRFV